MKLSENIKDKKPKYMIIISFFLAFIIILSFMGWSILTSENELKLIVMNSYDKKSAISLYILKKDSSWSTGEGFLYTSFSDALEYGDSYAYHVKFDKTHKIIGIRLEAYLYDDYLFGNISHSNAIASTVYYFTENNHYDLLAVIDSTGENITISKIPEPKFVVNAPID